MQTDVNETNLPNEGIGRNRCAGLVTKFRFPSCADTNVLHRCMQRRIPPTVEQGSCMDRVTAPPIQKAVTCQSQAEHDDRYLKIWLPQHTTHSPLPRMSSWGTANPAGALMLEGASLVSHDRETVCTLCSNEPELKPVQRQCYSRHRLVTTLKGLRDDFNPAIASSCLRMAAHHGHEDIVLAVLNLGAKINAPNLALQNALMAAAGSSHRLSRALS